MYPFDRDIVWHVRKVYIKESAASLAAAESLTFPTKLSAPLTELNSNAVYSLTTDIEIELSHKRRRAEVTSATQAERVPSSYP